MGLNETLEYNKPILKSSISKIEISTNKIAEVDFTIENSGDGILEGEIFCCEKYISFNKTNLIAPITYVKATINSNNFAAGETINCKIKIISNGGDLIIPVCLKVINECLATRNGKNIFTIKDFYNEYLVNKIEMRSLFFSKKFEKWLISCNEEYLSIYEFVKKDIASSIENFFVLNGIKENARFEIINSEIEVIIEPFSMEKIEGIITLKKTVDGYIDTHLEFTDCNWLTFGKMNIQEDDFTDDEYYQLQYTINTSKITKKVDETTITFKNDDQQSVKIKVKKTAYINIDCSHEVFVNGDSGLLKIVNLTSLPIFIEAISQNPNVIIDSKNLVITNDDICKFHIKLTYVQLAMVKLLRQPYFVTKIVLKGSVNNIVFTKNVDITIATSSLELR